MSEVQTVQYWQAREAKERDRAEEAERRADQAIQMITDEQRNLGDEIERRIAAEATLAAVREYAERLAPLDPTVSGSILAILDGEDDG